MKQLTLSKNGKIGGVCAGLAEYAEVDVTIVRLIAALALLASMGSVGFAYLVMWAVIPSPESI